jgi:hypothetical protein
MALVVMRVRSLFLLLAQRELERLYLHRGLYIHIYLNFYCILPNSSKIKEF